MGFIAASSLNTMLMLDLNDLSTSVISSENPPSGRSEHSAVLYESKMILYGGMKYSNMGRTTQYCGDTFMCDLDTFTWTKCDTKNDPPNVCGHSAVIYQHQMWIFGGYSDSPKQLNVVRSLDLKSFTWRVFTETCGIPPSPRYHHGSTVFQGKLIIFGGDSRLTRFERRSQEEEKELLGERKGDSTGKSPGNTLDGIFIFDIESRTWTRSLKSSLPLHCRIVSIGGRKVFCQTETYAPNMSTTVGYSRLRTSHLKSRTLPLNLFYASFFGKI